MELKTALMTEYEAEYLNRFLNQYNLPLDGETWAVKARDLSYTEYEYWPEIGTKKVYVKLDFDGYVTFWVRSNLQTELVRGIFEYDYDADIYRLADKTMNERLFIQTIKELL